MFIQSLNDQSVTQNNTKTTQLGNIVEKLKISYKNTLEGDPNS